MKALRLSETLITYTNEETEANEQPPPQQRQAFGETEFDSFPDPIVEQILTRLPAKAVFRSMSVSKPWLSIMDSPRFAPEHFSNSVPCPLLVFNDRSCFKKTRILHLDEGRSTDLIPSLQTRIEFPDTVKGRCRFIHHQRPLATSCRGLVCWATRAGVGDIIVCNPITGEYAFMNAHEKGKSNERELVASFIGLGFNRAANTFELLKMTKGRMVDGGPVPISWWPEVCTVGPASRWRRVGDADFPFTDFSRSMSEVVYADGALYWRYDDYDYDEDFDDEYQISTFDFDGGVFREVMFPTFQGYIVEAVGMGVLNDRLCVSFVCPHDGHVELWTLSRDDNNDMVDWRMVHNVATLDPRFEGGRRVRSRGQYEAIGYVEDKILMHDWGAAFLAYDSANHRENLFRLPELPDGDRSLDMQVVVHVPNIMPMKDALNLQDDASLIILKAKSR